MGGQSRLRPVPPQLLSISSTPISSHYHVVHLLSPCPVANDGNTSSVFTEYAFQVQTHLDHEPISPITKLVPYLFQPILYQTQGNILLYVRVRRLYTSVSSILFQSQGNTLFIGQ
jgi:hypothetical protein